MGAFLSYNKCQTTASRVTVSRETQTEDPEFHGLMIIPIIIEDDSVIAEEETCCSNYQDTFICGNVNCLQKTINNTCLKDKNVCRAYAKNGHIECLKFAIDSGCCYDISLAYSSMLSEDKKIIDYVLNIVPLRASKCSVGNYLCFQGKLKTLEYLISNNKVLFDERKEPFIVYAENAIRSKNLEMVKFVFGKMKALRAGWRSSPGQTYHPCSQPILLMIYEYGTREIIQWIVDNGFLDGYDLKSGKDLEKAIDAGNMDAIKWFVDMFGNDYFKKTNLVFSNGQNSITRHLHVLKWFLENEIAPEQVTSEYNSSLFKSMDTEKVELLRLYGLPN